jgi:hypothetical protein
MIEETNLEKYYYYTEVRLIPFEALSQAELDELELSEGFEKFLKMKNWTIVLSWLILVSIIGGIILTGYLKNN